MQKMNTRLAVLTGVALSALTAGQSSAADLESFTFMTSWYAEAQHGGFYQAKALGLYEAAGLDVTLRMGGPQVNGMQLLLAGETDVYTGYDFQVLSGVEKGLPVRAVAATFQHDVNGILTHEDVTGLDDLADKTLLIATSARTSWWPWLRENFGLSDAQTQPYTFNLQPFMVNPEAAQQAFPWSEPYALQEQGVAHHFYLLADKGYPPYGLTLVTRHDVIGERGEVLQKFLSATVEGWKSYLEDPEPGNVLIKEANDGATDATLAFGLKTIRDMQLVTGGDAAEHGIGTMTAARWQASYDYMVGADLLSAGTDWQQAFTTEFIDNVHQQAK